MTGTTVVHGARGTGRDAWQPGMVSSIGNCARVSYQGMPSGIPQVAEIVPALAAAGSGETTGSRFHTSVPLAAPGTAAFVRETTSRFADTSRLTAGRARSPGSLIGRTSWFVLLSYKSRSGRLAEKRRGTAPPERREIRGVLLRTFRRCPLPFRDTSSSPARLRRACFRSGGRRRDGATLYSESSSSTASC